MSFINKLPSWENVIDQAGIGNDPFLYLLDQTERIAHPKSPDSLFGILLGFAAIYLILIFVCFSIFLIPFLRGKEARKRHFWIYKKQHLTSTTTPYYILNSGLVMILSQLAGCLIFEIYIFLNYQSAKSPHFSCKAYLYVCLELCWLPGYIGFHVTAFGSLYAYLSSPRRINSSQLPFYLRPKFLNTIFFFIPILVTSNTLGWCIALFLNARNQSKSNMDFVTEVLNKSKTWNTSSISGEGLVLLKLADYLKVCDQHVVLTRWSSACWALIGVIFTIFYAVTVTALLSLLKRCMAFSAGKHCFTRTLEYHTDVEGSLALETKKKPITLSSTQPSVKRMRTGFVYLVGHCSIMLLCLLLDVPIGILMAVETERTLFDPKWRAVTNWITLISSCFVSIAILIHSWRIITERDTTQNVASIIDKPSYEEEVTPARFLVNEDELKTKEEESQKGENMMTVMNKVPKHTTFPSGLGLDFRSERTLQL